ncbi:hypothetical protein BK138_17090 [Paenibacillus rhizosphaerae]|uniref:Uncharacterized protein n=1 Tax=Paenibacillus rhizosphaerae TaxID=297318 RepID=A0A1R1ENW8_9BACL|nr:hypothetical protein BK138_17090 [Paenibacillus rhizosphaerae]
MIVYVNSMKETVKIKPICIIITTGTTPSKRKKFRIEGSILYQETGFPAFPNSCFLAKILLLLSQTR